MALHPEPVGPVPEETARVARAAFPKGHRYLRLRDELGTIYDDACFVSLFPALGRPAEAPWRLALVTVLQYAEGLSDRQAADAVRDRLAWKYLLGLELTDTGFDFSILSDFRARLVAGEAEALLLDVLLDRCKAVGLLKPRGRQRTDSTNVLAAVRALNRLEGVGETLRHALNTLAVVAPDWLGAQVRPDWYDRYGRRIETTRLPEAQAERDALTATMGADGVWLLTMLYDPTAPAWLREIPAVQTLRQMWLQHYYAPDPSTGIMRLREQQDLPPSALLLESPYDPDARFHTKRETSWTGYTVHLTETCDEDTPNLITQVATVPASTNDVEMTDVIQADLSTRDLLPGEHLVPLAGSFSAFSARYNVRDDSSKRLLSVRNHFQRRVLVDAGYVSGQHLLSSATTYGIDLVGPAPPGHQLASGRPCRFRGGLLRDRLGPAYGDLPTGQNKSPLERRDDEGWPPLLPGPFRSGGLPRLPRACAMYARRDQAPATRVAPTGGARRFTSGASAADHPRVQDALRPARRYRRNHGAGYPKLWSPTRAVPDLAQSAAAAGRDRRRHQFAATRRLVDRKATGRDPHVTLCGAGRGGLIRPSTFPTVSWMRSWRGRRDT